MFRMEYSLITIQKFMVFKIWWVFLEKKYTFIWQHSIKLLKSNNKDMYNVTKDFYFK